MATHARAMPRGMTHRAQWGWVSGPSTSSTMRSNASKQATLLCGAATPLPGWAPPLFTGGATRDLQVTSRPHRQYGIVSSLTIAARSLVHAALFVLFPRATAARVVGADLGCGGGLLAGLALDERLEGLVLVQREAVVGGVGGEHLWCHGTPRGWYAYGVRTLASCRGKLP